MEGQRFACAWKQEKGQFKVWVKDRPALTATGKTFGQADRRLWTVIIDATGDGESIRDYDPPEPAAEGKVAKAGPLDAAAWIERLERSRHQRAERESLDTDAKIERRFAERVGEHFAFLSDLGFKGPTFSRHYDSATGMTFSARFSSRKRTLEVSLDKARKGEPNGLSFVIDTIPGGDPFERLLSNMLLALKYTALGNLLAEFEMHHTRDEIMTTQFPLFAELFRGELGPLLRGEQWHDEYEFYRE